MLKFLIEINWKHPYDFLIKSRRVIIGKNSVKKDVVYEYISLFLTRLRLPNTFNMGTLNWEEKWLNKFDKCAAPRHPSTRI